MYDIFDMHVYYTKNSVGTCILYIIVLFINYAVFTQYHKH